MKIHQFYDNPLAHASYAILDGGEIILIDPGRDPKQYYEFAMTNNAKIVGVIETHPHADFASSHLQIHKETGATIYASKLVGAEYPHVPFDEGNHIRLGSVVLTALNTPGHSPDSICVVLNDSNGQQIAVFTGDTLFIGDCGRPDLREKAGNITAKREELARQLYHTLRNKLITLSDKTIVYPAHGAGSLCGKNLSDKLQSTIGNEKLYNWCLQEMSEAKFVESLLEGQPFVPVYFPYDVALNKRGVESLKESIATIPTLTSVDELAKNVVLIDVRDERAFKQEHLHGSINIPCTPNEKFETWAGSIVSPEEQMALIGSSNEEIDEAVYRLAKIGYEKLIIGTLIKSETAKHSIKSADINHFTENISDYTIVDIRQPDEFRSDRIFQTSINIPLSELRERIHEIPGAKPIMVHCAGGYRSAAGTSIIKNAFPNQAVFDLSTNIKLFRKS